MSKAQAVSKTEALLSDYENASPSERPKIVNKLVPLINRNQTACGLAVQTGLRINSYSLTVKACRTYLKHDPKNMRSLHELGKAYLDAHELINCQSVFNKMYSINPSHHLVHHLKGLLAYHNGDFASSQKHMDIALNLAPIDSDYDRSMCMMSLSEALRANGEMEKGWECYEARHYTWKWFHLDPIRHWDGQDLKDKHIFVFQEQGLADHVRFMSMLDELMSIAGKVTVTTPKKLHSLCKRSFPRAEFVVAESHEEIKRLFQQGQFDYQCSMFKVAAFLRKSLPFPMVSGLFAPAPEIVEKYKKVFDTQAPIKRVGIFWRSGVKDFKRKREATDLIRDWLPVLSLPGYEFHSLQYNDVSKDIADLKEIYGIQIVTPEFDQFNDIEQQAAYLSELDLVIGIPGFPVKLAQYCNTETWDLRWQEPGTCERNWQNGSRIISKSSQDNWEAVFRHIAELLKERHEAVTFTGSRNAPCPCGSNIRFKNCHGKI